MVALPLSSLAPETLIYGWRLTRGWLHRYGFTNVVTPADIIHAYPNIWPFARNFASYYVTHARPLRKPIYSPHESTDLSQCLKIDAAFIFNDPRDWALDTTLLLDLLLSYRGYLGTLSDLNGNEKLPNRGYQQNGQPKLFFSNPDLWWAAAFHLPRLGQGGFREAFGGVWRAVTGGEERGVVLEKSMFGKPHEVTYAFAERRLEEHRPTILGKGAVDGGLRNVYMVGGESGPFLEFTASIAFTHCETTDMTNDCLDNPESDIRGANQYQSPQGSDWQSILVRSGVYNGGEPAWKPQTIVDDVWDAVQWGLRSSGWKPPDQI